MGRHATADKLAVRIREASEAYYQTGKPIMSDREFDNLVEELRTVDPLNHILIEVGWGYKVHGAKVKIPEKIEKSLDKHYTPETALAALGDPEQVDVGPKLDGLSGFVAYDNAGYLKLGCTRGDGEYGIDITYKIPRLMNGPDLLQGPPGKVVRGELIMSTYVFEQTFVEDYENPRAAAVGIINGKSLQDLDRVLFIPHDQYGSWPKMQLITIRTVAYEEVTTAYLKNLYESMKKDGVYPVDGLVLSPTKSPRRKVAWKDETKSVDGTVKRVILTKQDSGRITPTLELNERFKLYGASIGASITAHNMAAIRDGKIGPGAKVRVTRANEIIPYLLAVVRPSPKPTPIPKDWEGKPVIWRGKDLYVKDAESERIGRLNRFMQVYFTTDGIADYEKLREALGIEGLEDISNLFGRERQVEELLKASEMGYGPSKISLIRPMFGKMRKLDAKKFLKSLNLLFVGDTLSESAADLLSYLSPVYDDEMTAKKFNEMIGAPSHAAQSIVEGWETLKMAYYIFRARLEVPKVGTDFAGQYICMTGAGWVSRKKLEALLIEKGFTVQGSVTSATNYLVQEDPNSTSDKSKAARKHGTPIISYDKLKEMLNV